MRRRLEFLLDSAKKIKHLVLSLFKSKPKPKPTTNMTQNSSPPKNSPLSSETPWKVDAPFEAPQIQQRSLPNEGIKRIRDTLHKLSPSGMAEKELLRKKNQYKSPLTHRNVDTFVTTQECNDACRPNQRTPDIQVAEWLQHVS